MKVGRTNISLRNVSSFTSFWDFRNCFLSAFRHEIFIVKIYPTTLQAKAYGTFALRNLRYLFVNAC
jgi:hypothetical protein